MKLEGSYEVRAPRQKVWSAFLDPETSGRRSPAARSSRWSPPTNTKATLKIGVAAVKGPSRAEVRLSDKKPSDSYRLAAEGSGGPGFVRADTLISLSDIEGGTRVSYSADVQVGGLIAGVGQRMIGGVSKMMADQFFNRMSEQLTTA